MTTIYSRCAAVSATTLVIVLFLGGCAGSEEPYARSPVSQSQSIPGVVHPTDQQQASYIRALQAISPKMAAQKDRAVSHGRNICLDLFNDQKNTESITLPHEMARDGIDRVIAEKVIDVTRANFCPESEFKPRL
jgi:hypothetical protein